MTTYRLGSSEMCSAPGIVRWAINGAKFKRDRAAMANIIAQGWSIPNDAALALVTGKASYTLDGETVVFDA